MDNNTQKLGRWGQFGLSVLLISNIILLILTWQARIRRLADLSTDVPFITGNFALVIGAVVVAIIFTLMIVFSARVRQVLTPTIVWGWIVVSLLGLAISSSLSQTVSYYVSGFFVWLLLVDVGLLLIAYQTTLSKLSMSDIVRQIVPIGFGLLLTFAMLEGLLRVYFTLLGTEADRVAYVYSVDKILSISNRYEGQPYTNYGLSTTHPEHNSQGYRGTELQTPKADSTYRIMTLGGSTTYGEGLTPEESYPAQLQDILHEDYGYTHIEVVNAGVNAYSSFDSLANLTYHILDDEPDMIIVYHGVNDVRARLVAPEFYTGRNEQRGYWNPNVLRQSLSPSVVIRFVSIQLSLIESPTQFETILGADGNVPRCGFFETTCTQVDNQSADIIVEQNPPIYFERNLVNMHAIATANDIDVVFSTWHYYADETELPNPMMLTHMQGAVDEQNNMIRLLGNQLDVPVINFASTTDLNNATYWQDGMHMTASGTRLQAEYYADFLIENDLLPPPPDNN